MDRAGTELVYPVYDEIESFSKDLVAVKLNAKYGLIDKTGKERTPFIYDAILIFSKDLAAVNMNAKYGLIDKTGNELTPFIYDEIESYSDQLIKVKLKHKYGLINKNGKELPDCKYDGIESFSKDLIKVKIKDKYGFVDQTGKEVIPCQYQWVWKKNEGLADVQLNGQHGIINSKGEEFIPAVYDEIYLTASIGYYVTVLNKKKGLWSEQGVELLPAQYDEIKISNSVLMRFKKDGKYGFFDRQWKEKVAAIYDVADTLVDGKAYVEVKDEAGYIDADGNYTFKTRVPMTLEKAVQRELVEFSAHGSSIQTSYMNVTNKSGKTLQIHVPAGTYLAAQSSSDQNMVLTSPADFTLAPNQTRSVSLNTACMNMYRDIPSGRSGFNISQLPEDHLLSKVINRLNKGKYHYSVIQAAVWIVTDGASYEGVGTLSYGGRRVIDRDDYDTAYKIVEEARGEK